MDLKREESTVWYYIQVERFSYLDIYHSDYLMLIMRDGKVYYVNKYVHVGTTIDAQLYRDNVIDVLVSCINALTAVCLILPLPRVALYPIYLIVAVCICSYQM